MALRGGRGGGKGRLRRRQGSRALQAHTPVVQKRGRGGGKGAIGKAQGRFTFTVWDEPFLFFLFRLRLRPRPFLHLVLLNRLCLWWLFSPPEASGLGIGSGACTWGGGGVGFRFPASACLPPLLHYFDCWEVGVRSGVLNFCLSLDRPSGPFP